MSLADVITPQWVKDRFLAGIDLTDDTGTAFPEALFQEGIDSAISILESDLDLVLSGTYEYVERRDTNDFHTESFFHMKLDHRPVVEVSDLNVQFGDYPSASIPRSWMHISSAKAGQVQVLPGPEGIGSIIFGGTAPFLGLAGLYGRPYTPLWFKIKYKAGFEVDLSGTVGVTTGATTITGTNTYFLNPLNDPDYVTNFGDNYGGGFMPRVMPGNYVVLSGTVDGEEIFETRYVKRVKSDTSIVVNSPFTFTGTGLTVRLHMYPPAILNAVGLLAAMLPLDTAGDLIVGAGIASKSMSVDGLSTSINTTASSTNAGYGARMLSYKNRLKDLIKSIKRDYRAPNVMVA